MSFTGVLLQNFQTKVYCLKSIFLALKIYILAPYQYIYAIIIVVLAIQIHILTHMHSQRELTERAYRESSQREHTERAQREHLGEQAKKQASTWSAFSQSHALEGLVELK